MNKIINGSLAILLAASCTMTAMEENDRGLQVLAPILKPTQSKLFKGAESLLDICIRNTKRYLLSKIISDQELKTLPTELQEKIKEKKAHRLAYKTIITLFRQAYPIEKKEENLDSIPKEKLYLFNKEHCSGFYSSIFNSVWKFKYSQKKTGIYDMEDNLVLRFAREKKSPYGITFAYHYHTPDLGKTLIQAARDTAGCTINEFDLSRFNLLMKNKALPLIIEGYLARKADPTAFLKSVIESEQPKKNKKIRKQKKRDTFIKRAEITTKKQKTH